MVLQKDEAHKLIDRIPPKATGDDLMNEICVREVIELGLARSNEDRTMDMKELREKYGLTE